MIFEHTYLNQDILHEAFVDFKRSGPEVCIREVSYGGDPLEDFVSYHPSIGASDDELTKICDDIYQTLIDAFVAKMKEAV